MLFWQLEQGCTECGWKPNIENHQSHDGVFIEIGAAQATPATHTAGTECEDYNHQFVQRIHHLGTNERSTRKSRLLSRAQLEPKWPRNYGKVCPTKKRKHKRKQEKKWHCLEKSWPNGILVIFHDIYIYKYTYICIYVNNCKNIHIDSFFINGAAKTLQGVYKSIFHKQNAENYFWGDTFLLRVTRLSEKWVPQKTIDDSCKLMYIAKWLVGNGVSWTTQRRDFLWVCPLKKHQWIQIC